MEADGLSFVQLDEGLSVLSRILFYMRWGLLMEMMKSFPHRLTSEMALFFGRTTLEYVNHCEMPEIANQNELRTIQNGKLVC